MPRPHAATALTDRELQPAMRWFLLHLVGAGLSLDQAEATLLAAARTEAASLSGCGVR